MKQPPSVIPPDGFAELVHELVQAPAGQLMPVVLHAEHEPAAGRLDGRETVDDRKALLLERKSTTSPLLQTAMPIVVLLGVTAGTAVGRIALFLNVTQVMSCRGFGLCLVFEVIARVFAIGSLHERL